MSLANKTQSNANQGFIIALLSAIVLSFTGIIIRIISEDYQLPALILAFWRDFFVVLWAFPFLLFLKPKLLKIKKSDMKFLLLFGLALAIFNIAWTLAVTLSGASVATVLVYSSAGFTAILGHFLLDETLGWKKITSIILCLIGTILVSGALDLDVWRQNTLGILSGVLSGLLYAVYSLMGRQAANRGINPWSTLFYSFFAAAVVLLVINLLPGKIFNASALYPSDIIQLGTEWRGWILLLLLAGGPTLIGFGLYNVSLGMLPSSTANLILTLEPVLTAITAYFLLDERLTSIEIAGSCLILTALILLRYKRNF